MFLLIIWYLECYVYGHCGGDFDFPDDGDWGWGRGGGGGGGSGGGSGGGGGGGGGGGDRAKECLLEAGVGTLVSVLLDRVFGGEAAEPGGYVAGAVVDCIDGVHSPKVDTPSGGRGGKGDGGGTGNKGDGDDGAGGGKGKDKDGNDDGGGGKKRVPPGCKAPNRALWKMLAATFGIKKWERLHQNFEDIKKVDGGRPPDHWYCVTDSGDVYNTVKGPPPIGNVLD